MIIIIIWNSCIVYIGSSSYFRPRIIIITAFSRPLLDIGVPLRYAAVALNNFEQFASKDSLRSSQGHPFSGRPSYAPLTDTSWLVWLLKIFSANDQSTDQCDLPIATSTCVGLSSTDFTWLISKRKIFHYKLYFHFNNHIYKLTTNNIPIINSTNINAT